MSDELIALQRKKILSSSKIKYLFLLWIALLFLLIAWLNLSSIIFQKTRKLMFPDGLKITDEQYIIYTVLFDFLRITSVLGYLFGGWIADHFRRNKALGYYIVLFFTFAPIAYFSPEIYGLTIAQLCLSIAFAGTFISIISLITEYAPMNKWATVFGFFSGSITIGHLISSRVINEIIYKEPSQIPNIFLVILILSILSLLACLPIIIHKDQRNGYVQTCEMSLRKNNYAKLACAAIAVEFLLILSVNLFFIVTLYNNTMISDLDLYFRIRQIVDFSQIIGGLLADKYGKKLLMFISCISIPLMASIYYVNSFTQFIMIFTIMKLTLTISYPIYPALIIQATMPQKWASMHGLRFFYRYLIIWAVSSIFQSYMEALYKEVDSTFLFIPKEYLFIAVAPLIVIVPIIMMIIRLIDEGKFKIKPK